MSVSTDAAARALADEVSRRAAAYQDAVRWNEARDNYATRAELENAKAKFDSAVAKQSYLQEFAEFEAELNAAVDGRDRFAADLNLESLKTEADAARAEYIQARNNAQTSEAVRLRAQERFDMARGALENATLTLEEYDARIKRMTRDLPSIRDRGYKAWKTAGKNIVEAKTFDFKFLDRLKAHAGRGAKFVAKGAAVMSQGMSAWSAYGYYLAINGTLEALQTAEPGLAKDLLVATLTKDIVAAGADIADLVRQGGKQLFRFLRNAGRNPVQLLSGNAVKMIGKALAIAGVLTEVINLVLVVVEWCNKQGAFTHEEYVTFVRNVLRSTVTAVLSFAAIWFPAVGAVLAFLLLGEMLVDWIIGIINGDQIEPLEELQQAMLRNCDAFHDDVHFQRMGQLARHHGPWQSQLLRHNGWTQVRRDIKSMIASMRNHSQELANQLEKNADFHVKDDEWDPFKWRHRWNHEHRRWWFRHMMVAGKKGENQFRSRVARSWVGDAYFFAPACQRVFDAFTDNVEHNRNRGGDYFVASPWWVYVNGVKVYLPHNGNY